jgi:hypothetical protein
VKKEATDLILPVQIETCSMVLPPPSNEVVEHVRASAGVNENRIQEAVKNLKEWLKLQPHLPHDYGKYFRCRYNYQHAACYINLCSGTAFENSVETTADKRILTFRFLHCLQVSVAKVSTNTLPEPIYKY